MVGGLSAPCTTHDENTVGAIFTHWLLADQKAVLHLRGLSGGRSVSADIFKKAIQ